MLPGFGVAGILGLAAIGAAMVLAMIGAAPTGGDVAQALAVLGASLVITAAVVLRLAAAHPEQRPFRRPLPAGRHAQSEGYISAPRGRSWWAATASRSPISGLPARRQIGGERVDVVTEGEYVAQGSPVRVLRSEGYRHVVRQAS